MSLSSEQDTTLMSLVDYVGTLEIPYEEIESATNNCADENLIEQNASFKVYKGQLSHSGELINIVARECLQFSVGQNELMMSRDLKHRNIVSMFKFANSGEVPFFIYKQEANGSLDKHLSGSTLTWMHRLYISVCVADALHYIHNLEVENDQSIIHGNIGSSKILLDHDWEPKLEGFAYAKRVKRHHPHLTDIYNGSLEYMDPEYETKGGLTHKSDVFSFGVVLFEVLFGRNASSINPIPDGDNWYFARLARSHYEAGTLDTMIDPDLQKQMDKHSLEIFSETAYSCLKEVRALRPGMDKILNKLRTALELQQNHESHVRSSNHLKGKNMDHLKISLSDIEFATNKFSSNCIGSGGYGVVYKAELDHFDGSVSSKIEGKNKVDFPKIRSTVAIKRLFSKQEGVEGFFTEIEMLTNCKHPNIVSLLGFCEEGSERILVYEHVSNGSLSDYFEKINKTNSLTWAKRIQICLNIAHGLNYLHSSTEEKQMIIHRDIKSDNILLDNNWVAKIADFGLSKLRPSNQSSALNTRIAGTGVYLDPEYVKTGRLKKESDIYSFGVVLFEIVSGKLAYDESYYVNNEKGFRSTIEKFFNKGALKKIVDPNLKEAHENFLMLNDGLNQESLDTFLDIAYQCLADTQAERPTMKVIINKLEKALNYQKNTKDNLHISLKDIKLATNEFGEDKCIGEGRWWKQYEGEVPHKNGFIKVIIKRWNKQSRHARHLFLTELKVLFEYKHENIIALVGHCTESGERIIVYEHASNGSLDKHLDNASLTWIERLKICISIASGLEFLHNSGLREETQIIHRDIKSSSILLDSNWQAKICNLELYSTRLEMDKIEHVTDNAYGSLGYIDPLYTEQGFLTDDSDIYSLGVVLMEILWGRVAWGEGCVDYFESLGRLAKRQYETGNLDMLVFEGIKGQIHPTSFNTFARIAVQCLDDGYSNRPCASEVLIQLKRALEYQESIFTILVDLFGFLSNEVFTK